MSIRRQCELVGISRSAFYYEPVSESAENLGLMRRLDGLHLEHPVYGSRRLTATFDAVASAAGGGAVSSSLQQERPAAIEIVHHHAKKKATSDNGLGYWESYERIKEYNAGLQPGPAGVWLRAFRGRQP